jgi:3-phosphoshikimate 1-carboxyvinyltransferase
MRSLGAESVRLPEADAEIEITPPTRLCSPQAVIDCGNSGTTARLLTGLVAGHPITATLDGDDSLRRRPMARVVEPLSAAGAAVRALGAPGRLPIEIDGGALQPIDHESEVASAQVKSALLLAGLAAGVPVTVVEPGASRDHTERMLSAMGASLSVESVGSGQRVRLEPTDRPLRPLDMQVPGDFSSAAFWLSLGLLGGCGDGVVVEGVGLNPGRTGFLRVLLAMGASIETRSTGEQGGEPVGDVVARSSSLRALDLPSEWVPSLLDEIPIIACLAARAAGKTIIRGAAELRVKESDRIAALHDNLSALGVACRELPDGLEIEGSVRPLAGRVETRGDHRIAMSFGVLGALPGNTVEIDDRACVQVSYPGFWEELERVVQHRET